MISYCIAGFNPRPTQLIRDPCVGYVRAAIISAVRAVIAGAARLALPAGIGRMTP